MSHLSVSEAAREIGARPKDISDLFYKRELRDDLAPIVGGRAGLVVPYDCAALEAGLEQILGDPSMATLTIVDDTPPP